MAVGSRDSDRGAALVMALVGGFLLTALAMGLLFLADTERRLAANDAAGVEAVYGADAAIERAVQDLAPIAQWDPVLNGAVKSSFADSTTRPTLASGQPIDLAALTAVLQATSNAAGSLGPNTPVWRLFGWGPMLKLAPPGWIDSRQYLAIWVADDPSDQDGNPSADSNGVVSLHAEAYGAGGARRVVEATVARSAPGVVRLLSWKEVR